MFVTPDYCRLMARWNARQNDGLGRQITPLAPEVLVPDRGAFLGSILGRLKHLLWAGHLGLARFRGPAPPPGRIADRVHLTPRAAARGAGRFQVDAGPGSRAAGLRAVDRLGDPTKMSGATGCEVSRPVATLVLHVFNRQTRHRGQVHAMLTAAGLRPADMELFLMQT